MTKFLNGRQITSLAFHANKKRKLRQTHGFVCCFVLSRPVDLSGLKKAA
jgi:hypothetical protein